MTITFSLPPKFVYRFLCRLGQHCRHEIRNQYFGSDKWILVDAYCCHCKKKLPK